MQFLTPFLIMTIAVLTLSCEVKDRTKYRWEEIPTHSKHGGEPNLHVAANGDVIISWLEYDKDKVSLLFSKMDGDNNQLREWSKPKLIASGDNWFVNWADFPSLASYRGNTKGYMASHWLQKSAEGTYDYDVKVSQSRDAGESWEEPFVIHDDGISAEHGFVSLLPLNSGHLFVTWLDGRNTKLENANLNSDEGHLHHGAMSLRASEIDINGTKYYDEEIDNKVCDCCQTSAAMTDKGPVVVYRNRSDGEIRDIYISRRENGKWLQAHSVHNDRWEINGCPVNGPVVVAQDSMVAVAWFTMAHQDPQVLVAFSYDNGDNFGIPIKIDNGNPMGRVDLLKVNDQEVLVSWVEYNQDDAAVVMLCRVHKSKGVLDKLPLFTTDKSRQSGFPRIEFVRDDLIVAWTTVDSVASVKSGILKGVK